MFETMIEELKKEIKEIYFIESKKSDQIQKEWIKISYDKPKIEKRLKELKEKCEILEESNISELEEKGKLEIDLANYYQAKKEKEEKLENLKDESKYKVLCAVKGKIIQFIDIVNDQKEKEIVAGKKIYDLNEEFDVKAFGAQIKCYDKFIEALEKINKYNGCVRTDEFCTKLANELDPEYATVIYELYKIIVTYLLDMRKEVDLNDLILNDEIEVEEQVVIEEKEVEEQATEEKEVEEQVVIEEKEVEEQATEEVIGDNQIEEKIFEEELAKKTSSLSNETTRFLELCNYVKLNLNQENIENLTEEYESLEDECEACYVCYKSLVNAYNSLVENKSKKLVTKKTLETYSKGRIIKEYFKTPFTIIKNSAYSEKRAYKKLEKITIEALEYPKTSNEYIEKNEQAKTLESNIVKKYIIKGVKLYKAKNKLAKMKMKLYNNDNEFTNKLFERKFNKQTKIISKELAPKLDSLTKRILKNNNEECICLILNQYLDLISNCYIKNLDEFYTKYTNYLYSIREKIGEDYFEAYNMAGKMIYEYRADYKLPYDLIKYNVDSGEVYNEIEDIINFYQFEIQEPGKKMLYIKRS